MASIMLTNPVAGMLVVAVEAALCWHKAAPLHIR
jgi:hypothetical protein